MQSKTKKSKTKKLLQHSNHICMVVFKTSDALLGPIQLSGEMHSRDSATIANR